MSVAFNTRKAPLVRDTAAWNVMPSTFEPAPLKVSRSPAAKLTLIIVRFEPSPTSLSFFVTTRPESMR
jgi:hypothetical protein